MKITKAIILAAGYGTRFLPITKAMPKEMLPVVDKPVIQYSVEDAVAAGIKDIIIVTSAQKRAIEDHFDHSFELESILESAGKHDLLDEVRSIPQIANFMYVRQKAAKGNLAAGMCGYEAMGEEPGIVMWGDDFFIAAPSRCQQLIAAYEKLQAPILCAIETSDPDHARRYGFAAGEEVAPGVIKVDRIVEKPGPEAVPSRLAIVGGFLFTPELMEYGKQVKPGANGEYLYTDALDLMVQDGKPVYAITIYGKYYDCGNKLDYIKNNVELALANPEMADELRDYLLTLTKQGSGTRVVPEPEPAEVK